MLLPNNVLKKSSVLYGNFLPYELSMKREHIVVGKLLFYISEQDFRNLGDDYPGEGRCYAYCEKFGRWCKIKVYKWRVVTYTVIKDEDEIKKIKEDLEL